MNGAMRSAVRVLVGMLGLDQHEVGALAVAGMLRDAGMEVIYLGRFNTPAAIVRAAIDEDADVIGISTHSWEYIEYLPELMTALREAHCDAAVVLGGSVITAGDHDQLRQMGVAAIFGAGSASQDIVAALRTLGAKRRAGTVGG